MASRLLISCVCDDRFWVGERGGGPTARCPAAVGEVKAFVRLMESTEPIEPLPVCFAAFQACSLAFASSTRVRRPSETQTRGNFASCVAA